MCPKKETRSPVNKQGGRGNNAHQHAEPRPQSLTALVKGGHDHIGRPLSPTTGLL
jgi:hypothetical protein